MSAPESVWAQALMDSLRSGFADAADPGRAVEMARYMRDQFPFHGVNAPQQKQLLSRALASTSQPPAESDLDAFARACYLEPEREWHYAAVALLRRKVKVLTPASIPLVHHMVVTHSWWDTVDAIASHLAGGLVLGYPETVAVMDEWSQSQNLWLARTAILHQLRFKERTDVDRLFGYCLDRADEPDFFYRKAIGWALRQYARTDPDAVRRFCDTNEAHLSALSLKEARKHL